MMKVQVQWSWSPYYYKAAVAVTVTLSDVFLHIENVSYHVNDVLTATFAFETISTARKC